MQLFDGSDRIRFCVDSTEADFVLFDFLKKYDKIKKRIGGRIYGFFFEEVGNIQPLFL